jgi:hypothetical protein
MPIRDPTRIRSRRQCRHSAWPHRMVSAGPIHHHLAATQVIDGAEAPSAWPSYEYEEIRYSLLSAPPSGPFLPLVAHGNPKSSRVQQYPQQAYSVRNYRRGPCSIKRTRIQWTNSYSRPSRFARQASVLGISLWLSNCSRLITITSAGIRWCPRRFDRRTISAVRLPTSGSMTSKSRSLRPSASPRACDPNTMTLVPAGTADIRCIKVESINVRVLTILKLIRVLPSAAESPSSSPPAALRSSQSRHPHASRE